MRSSLLERDVKKLLSRQCALRGIECVNIEGRQNRGVPDRMLIGPDDRFGFVEAKRLGKEPTKLQWRMIGLLKRTGIWVKVLTGGRDRDETLLKIEELLDDYHFPNPGIARRK